MSASDSTVAAAAPPCRLAVLISGRGTNLQAIVQAVASSPAPAVVCGVLSNRVDSAGLAWAAGQGLKTAAVSHLDYPDRDTFDQALVDVLRAWRPDYVLLAGFMRVLTPMFIEQYAGRLLNIHPSLLPSFQGLDTHARALSAGVRWHGCTVHFVTPTLDDGPIVAQGVVPVCDGDDAAALAQRVLTAEHRLYGQVVHWLAQGRVTLDAEGVRVQGEPARAFLAAPADTASAWVAL